MEKYEPDIQPKQLKPLPAPGWNETLKDWTF